MEDLITKHKLFWAWEDDKEEEWLMEQSQQGLHLEEVSFITYRFNQGPPQDYAYRLDYLDSSKPTREYLQIFADAGWEHLGTLFGWQYFRKLVAPGETAEIYTDPESKIQKYRRVQTLLLTTMPVYLIAFMTFDEDFGFWLAIVIFLLMGFYAYALTKIENRIKKLQV